MGAVTEATAKRIAGLRLQRGMTLADLHRLTGMHADSLSRLENGKRALSIDEVVKIATALDVHPAVLCGWVAQSAPLDVDELFRLREVAFQAARQSATTGPQPKTTLALAAEYEAWLTRPFGEA